MILRCLTMMKRQRPSDPSISRTYGWVDQPVCKISTTNDWHLARNSSDGKILPYHHWCSSNHLSELTLTIIPAPMQIIHRKQYDVRWTATNATTRSGDNNNAWYIQTLATKATTMHRTSHDASWTCLKLIVKYCFFLFIIRGCGNRKATYNIYREIER